MELVQTQTIANYTEKVEDVIYNITKTIVDESKEVTIIVNKVVEEIPVYVGTMVYSTTHGNSFTFAPEVVDTKLYTERFYKIVDELFK